MLAAVFGDTISGSAACACEAEINAAIEAASGFRNLRSIEYPLRILTNQHATADTDVNADPQ